MIALLYTEWEGKGWDNSNGWWTDASECTWIKVTCNGDEKVVAIGFGGDNNIFGTVSQPGSNWKE